MKFSEIYGYEDLKQTLVQSVEKGHVAHALMFSGKPGGGNLAMALAFAQYLNCQDPQNKDSCGKCASCSKYEKLIHPDLMLVFPTFSAAAKEKEKVRISQIASFREQVISFPYLTYSDWTKSIDAEKKQCIISVDEGRNIAKNVSMKAFEAKYKIVLIWLPELMNQSCANSILKILEEPPEKTIYLLVTNDFEKNMVTILSRTQIINVPNFADEAIASFLEDKHFIAKKRAAQIAKYADGSLRQARKLMNQEVDNSTGWFVDWMRSTYKADIPSIVNMGEDFAKFSRAEQLSILRHGLDIGREIMLNNIDLEELKRVSEDDAKFLEGFSKVFDNEKLETFVTLLNEAQYHIERNLNVKILFLDLSLNLAKALRKK